MADELVDILAEVLFIAHDLGLDMPAAWDMMIESDHHKIAERVSEGGFRRKQAS